LLVDEPVSTKTLGIEEQEKTTVYFYGSNITNRMLEVLDHYGDVIHLVRGGTALNIPFSQLEHQAHTAYDNGLAIDPVM
jgi:hypothetical protein